MACQKMMFDSVDSLQRAHDVSSYRLSLDLNLPFSDRKALRE
jgi:hypothetical protein